MMTAVFIMTYTISQFTFNSLETLIDIISIAKKSFNYYKNLFTILRERLSEKKEKKINYIIYEEITRTSKN